MMMVKIRWATKKQEEEEEKDGKYGNKQNAKVNV